MLFVKVLATVVLVLVSVVLAAAREARAGRLDSAWRLPVGGLSGSLQNPCWAPSGDRLALSQFSGRYNTGASVVRVVSMAGGRLRATVSPVGAQSVNLPGSCWTASGDLIAFSSDVDGVDRVYVAPAAGGPARVATPRNLVAFEPSFAPGGRWISFQRVLAGRSEIWKVRVDGSGLRQLTAGHDDREPNWSPSGDRIVFQRHSGGQADLWTIDPSGGHARNLTRTPQLEETDASWSPDGRYLVFSSSGDGVDVASLFTIRTSGGSRRRLTRTRGIYDGAPSWSPDGRWIAFESTRGDPDRSRGATIWLIRAPTGFRSAPRAAGLPVTDAHALGELTLRAAADYVRAFAEAFTAERLPIYRHLVVARSALESCVISWWLSEPGIARDERVKPV
jgi:TolB protein